MMKRMVFLMAFAALCTGVSAASNGGFGLDAFNRAVSASARGNVVFSPYSFEIDCVLFCEAFGALTRAKFAETMGVLNGLESVYKPINDRLVAAYEKNFSVLSARAFCLPDERKAHPTYRQWMQNTFAAEAFTFDFRKGAECWFRSRLDGEMEGFTLPEKAAGVGAYSFFDVISVRASWKDPFPTNNTRDIAFQLQDGSSKSVSAMCDLRVVDIWKRKNHEILRLPLADDAWFFVLLPSGKNTVRDIRGDLSSATLLDIISGIKSITEDGISHGAAAVVIPKMDITTDSDLKLPLGYFQFPMTDMDRMEKGIQPRQIRQCVRFRLDEKGMDAAPVAEKAAEQMIHPTDTTSRFVLNRPFLFFIYHEPTSSIPIVGQFTGL